jgi:hypothetical protein
MWISLTPARRLIAELMHQSRNMPQISVARRLELGDLPALRKSRGIGWPVVFMKAFGLVAQKHRILRQSYVKFPWPHIYEHPFTTCALMVERDIDGETCVLGSRFRWPERVSLRDLDAEVRRVKTAPVESVNHFREFLRFGRLPAILRRLGFWSMIAFSGKARAKKFGTFVLSTLGPQGTELESAPNFLSYYFTFGPIDEAGGVTARLMADHRVADAMPAARCLVELERVLTVELRTELESLEPIAHPSAGGVQGQQTPHRISAA